MKNAGLRIKAEVVREDGTIAQEIHFGQYGLEYSQLLELQSKGILPLANTVMEIMAKWNVDAGKASASA